jgi:hypothetical protein
MRRRAWVAMLGLGIMLSLSACAGWGHYLEMERKGGAHFVDWQHMGYSLFRATPKETTKSDIVASKEEHWWGDPVLVEPIQ